MSEETSMQIGISQVHFFNTLSQLLYQLLKDNTISIIVYTAMTIIQLVQILYFKFYSLVTNVWNDNNAALIGDAFGYLNFAHYIAQMEYSLYQVIFYLVAALITLWFILLLTAFILIMNQKAPGEFLIGILAPITQAMITILYIPLIHILTIPLTCDNGNFRHFPSQQCWAGLVVIDHVIAIMVLILFIVTVISISFLHFQGMHDVKRVQSRRNGRCQTLYIAHVTLIVLLTLLPLNENSQVFFEVYQLAGIIICFLYTKQNDAHNYRLVQKLQLTMLTVDMWTSLMLCIANLVENRIMVGSLYTWLFCLPLVLVVQFIQQQPREQSLMIYVNKFDSPVQLVNHAQEVLKLVELDRKRLPEGQLLNGYIEFHNQTCPNPLCPLKKVKFSLNMFKAKNEIISKTDKRHTLVFDTMSRLFMLGIGKFPADTFIRIEFAMYTLRILKSKPQALEELSNIGKLKLSYDQRYIINYIRSVIEAEISELTGEGQDFTEQRDFEEKFNLFKSAMERSVALLMEFWSQFADEKPDLIKLYEIGSKLFPIRTYVDTAWKRLQRIQNQQLPTALRLYSKYLIEIFNDRLAGFELLEQARKIETQFSQRKAFKLGATSNLNVDGQEDGCAFLSLEEEQFGQLYAVNMSAASFFGYDKSELLHKKVNNIMPNMYARYHDDFLKRFIDTNEATLLNKERQLLSKNKNGYLYPVNVLLRPVYHVLKEGVEFVATLKKEKRLRDVGYLVCNKEYLIEDITPGCLNLLGIDLKILQMQEVHMTDLFPDVLDNLFEYKAKGGLTIDYNFPLVNDDGIKFRHHDQPSLHIMVQVTEINFLIMKSDENDAGLAGYQIRVEKAYESNITNSQLHFPPKRPCNFQFRPTFSALGMSIQGEFTDMTSSELLTHIQDSSMAGLNQDFEAFKMVETKPVVQEEENGVDLAQGIRTLRLFDGQLMEIDKFQSEGDMDSYEEEQNHIKKEEQQEEEHEGEGGYFRSSKELQETLNAQSESRTIRWLSYSSLFLLMLLIILCILNNVFERSEISSQQQHWSLMLQQTDLIMEVNHIAIIAREMMQSNMGIQLYNQTYLTGKLEVSITNFDQLAKDIFRDQPSSVEVMMYSTLAVFELSVLEQASQQIVSKALNILKSDPKLIVNENIDYFYVYYNVLNDYMTKLLDMYMTTVSDSKDQTESLYDQLLAILIFSACLTIVASILFSCILTSTLDKRQEILSIFLDIPEKTAKLFYTKCENFLQSIGSNDDDEVESEIEFVEERNVEESVSLLGRKKKRFKNNENKHFGFFIKMILIGIVIQSYYILIFFLSEANINKKSNILNEFNQTALSASYYAFVINCLKQHIFDDTIPLLNGQSNVTINMLIDHSYQIDTTYQKLHAVNIDYNDESYINYYNKVMFQDICLIIINAECATFADSILEHGLMTSVSRHFQNIRKLYNAYQYILHYPTEAFPFTNYTILNLDDNPLINKKYNLLNVPESFEINAMQYTYLQLAFDDLKYEYYDVVRQNQDKFIVQQLILMIFYLIALILAWLVCWAPFLRSLNREIWSTKCLLTFIPIDEIAKIRTINNYIRTVILEQNI